MAKRVPVTIVIYLFTLLRCIFIRDSIPIPVYSINRPADQLSSLLKHYVHSTDEQKHCTQSQRRLNSIRSTSGVVARSSDVRLKVTRSQISVRFHKCICFPSTIHSIFGYYTIFNRSGFVTSLTKKHAKLPFLNFNSEQPDVGHGQWR